MFMLETSSAFEGFFGAFVENVVLQYLIMLLPVIVFGCVFFITLKVKIISRIFALILAVGTGLVYFYRDVLSGVITVFEFGLNDFTSLSVFLCFTIFFYIIYIIGDIALKMGKEGFYYEVEYSDSSTKKWSVLGWYAFISAIAAAVIGIGVAWLERNIWNGFVYVLSAVETVIVIILFIADILDR